MAALPLGVWLAGHLGYRPVFAAGGLAALAGIASLPWLPNTRSITTRADGMLAALRNPALVRPAALFSATTMAVGIIVTFLPLAVTRADANAAALALLVQPAAAIAGRWLAGRHGDRPSGQQRSSALLVPGVLAAAAGVLVLSLTAVPAAVIAGAAVFGLGFGVCQNVTQTVMYDRVPESAYGASSALWNLAYDGGMGLGAAGFGVIALHTGYPVAFVLVAVVLAGRAPGRGKNTRRGPFGMNLVPARIAGPYRHDYPDHAVNPGNYPLAAGRPARLAVGIIFAPAGGHRARRGPGPGLPTRSWPRPRSPTPHCAGRTRTSPTP